MKTVAIVGAGPAGLVAAKTLLQHAGGTKFKVTVFEAAERVGGMWRAMPNEKGDKCSPQMRTNLSRFTVSFPDLPWESVDLLDSEAGSRPSGNSSMFPEAWKVGRYLETYAKRYLSSDIIRLSTRVIAADLDGAGLSGTWRVSSVDNLTKQQSTDSYDYLIIASGFFDKTSHAVHRAPNLSAKASASIQHSSQFRDVASLAEKPGKVVVIGGGISGSEAAATAAFQISNARHSPGKTKPAWAESTVYHVFNRPFYCLPRYIPQNPYNPSVQDFNLSPHFLPLDLILYNLTRRGEGPISASNGQVPPEKAKKGHEFIRSTIGGDQRDTGYAELVYNSDNTQYPAYTGVTDTYTEFVRSRLIVPIQGQVETIIQDPASSDNLSIEVKSQKPWAIEETKTKVDGISGIIEATGFQVHLDYLSDRVKQALEYDHECHRVPFLLSRGSILNPQIPNIAFIGFYEGPYWAVMEAQAHLVAQVWDAPSNNEAIAAFSDISESLTVRQAIKKHALDVPQFWMADYVGLVEEISRGVGVQRDDEAFGGQSGPLFPARYWDSNTDKEATNVVKEVADILRQSQEDARFVAAAAFRAMQGKWDLQRKIDSRHTSMPGGTFKGIAYFHPRLPTAASYVAEYLYIEEGKLTMDNGVTFPATRRYVYRFDEDTETITAWFAKDDGLTVDNLFNTWEFYEPSDVFHGWLAKGSHWCSPDTYKSNCEFRFRGASLETFGITYDVSGPKKDYSHESWYSRPKPGTE